MVSALVAAALWIPTLGCVGSPKSVIRSKPSQSLYRAFTDPQAVTIRGYSGDAMEPFVTRDGAYLFFNTSNVAPHIVALQYASRADARTFVYQGAVQGANQPDALSGTPTMDRGGDLYFVSPRSYSTTLSTIYVGRFDSGRLNGLHLASGISPRTPGVVDFDVEVNAQGTTLFVSVGRFNGGSAPTSASLAVFDKSGDHFTPDHDASMVLRAVNQPGKLTYAASISTNGLELFFTRVDPTGGGPGIYRAVRTSLGQPFGDVQRVAAVTGFAEAPSISADRTTLYYHRMVGTHFEIAEVTRP